MTLVVGLTPTTMATQLFEEQLAEKLQEKFGLANSTIRVWKHRNQIPTKYLREDYVKPETASKAQAQRVATLLQLKYVNRAGVEGITAFRLRDFLKDQKHAKLQKIEAKNILKQFQSLQRKAQKVVEKKSPELLLDFIKQPILKPLCWLDNYKLYNRLRQGLKQIPETDWVLLETHLNKLIQDLDKNNESISTPANS